MGVIAPKAIDKSTVYMHYEVNNAYRLKGAWLEQIV